jgi:hypothetical protein
MLHYFSFDMYKKPFKNDIQFTIKQTIPTHKSHKLATF